LPLNLAQKIIAEHLIQGRMIPGEEIAIKIDQTLTQDATGTMAYLQFEALGLPRVKVDLAVSYVDHNTLQIGFENADDHLFLQSVAAKYGVIFSRPGNGICHQVHLERFAAPGKTLLGSDSHTPTAGGIGSLAMGAGGLEVAVAMAGMPFYLCMPKIVRVNLYGRLGPWVSAKDVILELLRRLTVKGGVGKIFEYNGEGIRHLSVPERATITNMGAELGATTSIFPSDDITLDFLKRQGREKDFRELSPDEGASYDEVIDLDLTTLEPLVAQPHMPDNVAPVREVGPIKIHQVAIGSCTNSSYTDLMKVAAILKGKRVHPEVSLVIAPGSRQVLHMLAQNGALADLIAAGARILECACGPCIGMGQAPPSGGVSLRTFNRNFQGRSGTPDALVYLASPEVAAASALTGRLTDPRELGDPPSVSCPEAFYQNDNLFLFPPEDGSQVEIRRGPNIKPLPLGQPLEPVLTAPVLLKVGDNTTTDHITPAGSKYLPLRSNIPALAEYTFHSIDPTFARRAKEAGRGIILGGENYGQGSSREHAAFCPMYLGIRAVIARSFARIHRSNLINFGVLPLTLVDPEDYHRIGQGDVLELNLEEGLAQEAFWVKNLTRGFDFKVMHHLSPRQKEIIRAGGLLNYTKGQIN